MDGMLLGAGVRGQSFGAYGWELGPVVEWVARGLEFKLYHGRSVGAAKARRFGRRAGVGGATLSELTAHGRRPADLGRAAGARRGSLFKLHS